METKAGNIVVTNATSTVDSVPEKKYPSEKRFKAEKSYRISKSIFDNMLKNGLITTEEYAIIDTNIKQKYNPISCDL